jgi:uncharacterized protein
VHDSAANCEALSLINGKLLIDSRVSPVAAHRCDSFLARARGLLLRPRLGAAEALLIEPCSSVHMFGMTYAIDVAFVDRAGVVLKVVSRLPPFGLAAAPGAHAAWEFAANSCERLGIRPGVRLSFEA